MHRRVAEFTLICLYALQANRAQKTLIDEFEAESIFKENGIADVSLSAGIEDSTFLAVSGDMKKSDRTLLVRVQPEYPEALRRLRIGGVVRLRVLISPKGSVKNVTMLGGNPILGDAAITAVKKWIYTPAVSETTTEITVRFDPYLQ
jgi:TonB family protein